MRRARCSRVGAGREAAARPEPLPGLGMLGRLSGLLEGGLRKGPPASPRPQEPRGLRDPLPGQAGGAQQRAGSRPSAGEGGERGETRLSEHPGKDQGGSGKLAASSRSRLHSPSFILPEIISFTENICLHY